ncbi:MAG: hypothetical protein FWD16_03640, partial [Clostridia bacterium]|nr:hypothetical protein [Clostridia bacterium]
MMQCVPQPMSPQGHIIPSCGIAAHHEPLGTHHCGLMAAWNPFIKKMLRYFRDLDENAAHLLSFS